MRVSTAFIQFQSVTAMLGQQAKLTHTQNQLSSGQRILTPSDDPTGAAKALDLDTAIEQTRQFQRNIDTTRERLSLEDTTLGSANNVLQRVRELAVQGLNATNSPADRKSIAAEVRQLKDSLLGLANTKQTNGDYMFSGYASQTPPFSETAITVGTVATYQYAYAGDANQRRLPIGDGKTVADSDPGLSVFGTPFDHGNPPANLPTLPVNGSAFDVLNKLADDFTAGRADNAILNDLDTVMNRISGVQASVGARLNRLDAQESVHEDMLLKFESARSDVRDLDYAEAISRFNIESASLQAAQQAYMKVQKLSLFNYL